MIAFRKKKLWILTNRYSCDTIFNIILRAYNFTPMDYLFEIWSFIYNLKCYPLLMILFFYFGTMWEFRVKKANQSIFWLRCKIRSGRVSLIETCHCQRWWCLKNITVDIGQPIYVSKNVFETGSWVFLCCKITLECLSLKN